LRCVNGQIGRRDYLSLLGVMTMNDYSFLSSADLNDRIAILRDNIRQLTEQAAGSSGAGNEERIAERMFQQQEELDALVRERDSRTKK
jgi:uncharacterized small protein (DUF1192 family)